jgi:putative transcriptional regulator
MARSSGPVRPGPDGDLAGKRIRSRRNGLGLSQQALAKTVDVSRQTIVSMEQGNYAPSVYLALKVASTLDATVEELWG